MDLLRAVVLGIIQGLTEFLPISSSGHLILVPALFKWPDQGLAFDVGLHLGTLVALLLYFWRDWWVMATTGLRDLGQHSLRFRKYQPESQLLWLIALGSVPTAIVGLLFDDWFEANVRQAWLVAVALAIVGTIMLVADRKTGDCRTVKDIGMRDAVFIGLAQACALVPGVSRSGATISMALFRDFRRSDAARFAFLLGTPAFVGAALFKSAEMRSDMDGGVTELAVGFLVSALVGLAVIHFLLRYLQTRNLVPFVAYRYGAAILTLVIAAVRVA
ncbi:MAG: undecaprenyl-diphosphatase UppP [Dehalococcoidia bacterium]|nr:undecaprenyl-diphosphatase UppP [Dehalococcoidia bacterium]